MAIDRITKVAVRFEDQDGNWFERTYKMLPAGTFIKAQNPQGKIPGSLNVFGSFRDFTDTEGESGKIGRASCRERV